MAKSDIAEVPRLRVLVVGGRSRAAQAFRRLVCQQKKFAVAVLTRQILDGLAGEEIIVVPDYFDPPDTVLQATDVAVNFVGAVHHDESQLCFLNIEGPAHLAQNTKKN